MAVENVCLSSAKMVNSWEQILELLQGRISRESFENWFKGTTYLAVDGETLLVSVPDRETRILLETEYADTVRSAVRELGLPVRQVAYESAPAHGNLNQILARVERSETENGP